MNQLSLFAEAAEPAWRPDPDRVRARLDRILGEARDPAAEPWDAAQASLYRTIVPDMLRLLPPEEAEERRAALEAELDRLGL
jgi:hypothetical protein